MKRFFLTIGVLTLITFSYAQKTVAVLNGTTWTFYDDFSPALRAAPSGATIYVPGGTFDLGTNGDTINKPITIIGVGHYPDSTTATQKTLLSGNIYFASGGDNVYISGMEISGYIMPILGTVINSTISRCKFSYINIGNGTAPNYFNMNNINVSESVFGYIEDKSFGASNVNLEKSILRYMSGIRNATVKNNCIIGQYNGGGTYALYYTLWEVYNSYFENNVILNWTNDSTVTNNNNGNYPNTFYNNIISGKPLSIYVPLGSIRLNNIYYSTLPNTFVSVGSPFSYNYDYHLLATSAGKNAGTDGTDIGIYGTAYPYKASAVPPNPHISTKSIAPTSVANGTLPVNIKVVAQDR